MPFLPWIEEGHGMRGITLVDRETGVRSLYVPEEHIQISIYEAGDLLLFVPLRTDGYCKGAGGQSVAVTDFLRQAYLWTSEVEVPDETVQFAIKTEAIHQAQREATIDEIVDDIEDILAGKRGDSGVRRIPLNQESLDDEERHARIVQEILRASGGLQ